MSEESDKGGLEEKLEECEKKLEELKRLEQVEKSVISGLREGGFSDKAIGFFRYRRNFLVEGDPLGYSADAIGNFTGSCGDTITIYLRIKGNTIRDAKYRTDGCPGAVTSASALTELIRGKNIEEASKLNVDSVVEFLKEGSRGLPKNMYDCCGIAVGSLRKAIGGYKKDG